MALAFFSVGFFELLLIGGCGLVVVGAIAVAVILAVVLGSRRPQNRD